MYTKAVHLSHTRNLYWQEHCIMKIRIRIRIHLMARRNLLWDILRLLSNRRAALGLYIILTLWRTRGANQPSYALLHIGTRRAMHYAMEDDIIHPPTQKNYTYAWPKVAVTCCMYIKHYFSLSLQLSTDSQHIHISAMECNQVWIRNEVLVVQITFPCNKIHSMILR